MRADEQLKKDFYTNVIMGYFINNAHYPTSDELESVYESINFMESLYRVVPVVNGELFNTLVYNAQAEMLEQDLIILFTLLKKYTEDEYNRLSQYADATLSELEKKVDFYLTKSRLEMQSSDLGKTVLFKRAPFLGEQTNSYFNIDCGEVSLTNGSLIHLLVEGNNINYARLKLKSEKDTIYLTPYELNMQYFKVPGDLVQNEINLEIPNTPKPNKTLLIPYKPKSQCDYAILTGKNKIAIKTPTKIEYPDYTHILCYEESMIDFYVKDGTSIQIRVSARPTVTNYDFSQEVIKLEKGIRHFYLKMPAKSAVEILIEGCTIYAQKAKGIVKSEQLYFTQSTSFKEFLLLEKSRENKTLFQASLEVKSTIEELGIESIMIKELIK